MSSTPNESTLELALLDWLRELGWSVINGPEIEPEKSGAERQSFEEVVLVGRLRSALERINPQLPADALDEALRQVLAVRHTTPSLTENNRRFQRLFTEGVSVEARRADGSIGHDPVLLADFETPGKNEWLAVNQFTVVEGRKNRRPDVVLFLNGLPVGVIELKNPADENATIDGAVNQLQTYKHDIPSLFTCNGLLVISDGLLARAGSLTADKSRFMPWRTIDGTALAPRGALELETLTRGLLAPARLLDFLRHFTVFEADDALLVKKIAGYHQYHAVNKAVIATAQAAGVQGDKRAGVIWHTQGSGKSLTMVFYAGKLIQHPALANPTLVLLTDRNDLDNQLFATFSACHELLRQKPQQAESREHLRELLKTAAGGVIFTTLQKFSPPEKGEKFPLLSDRRNVVVIADEAHRSQYDFIDGFARHLRDGLPNATFIGFTGTPIESADKSTPAVFGDYIDVYDIQRAVEDGATVRIYYEGRLAKLELKESERPTLDTEFEEVTEEQEATVKEKLKSKWARLEAMVGTEKRINLIARDLVDHFENRRGTMEGKGMVVAMSRRICVDLYAAIIKLRPQWHSDDDAKGFLKVVMTGSAADPQPWQPHIRNKAGREAIAKRFKAENDPLKLVIVRDMWLTGFDVPCLHTMYLDKPMRGHGLMQAIARVNRVFKDKPGGLVVDYLGLADPLKRALMDYTEADRQEAGVPQEEAVAVMEEKYEICAGMLHGFEYRKYFTGTPTEKARLPMLAMEFIAAQDEGKSRWYKAVADLSKAFALSVPHERALAIRDEVAFFQALRAAFIKFTEAEGTSREDLDCAIRQIVSRAVASDEVVDIFAAAGLKRPDIAILDDAFLKDVRDLPQKNLALEMLRKLLSDAIKQRMKKNLVQSRTFSDMLEKAIRQYQNRAIETAQVISELIELAKTMRAADQRGEKLGLNPDEEAFYDALAVNDSAVQVLGDAQLKIIAQELVIKVRENASIDWTLKESVRAKLRALVKRILRKYGYPPDLQEKATDTVLQQAELLAEDWAA